MNAKKIICALAALLLLIIAPIQVFAEARNIYIGDIITLQITSRKFSADELRIKFQDFEIIEIKDESGGYSVSLRTFEAGERKILLGDKEIIINVQSALDNISSENIFEGDTRVAEPGFLFHWRVLFYICAGISVISGGFILLKMIVKRKVEPLSSRQLFLRRCESLSPEDKNYFVDLTYYFKEYLESLYRLRIIGKTSAEIINELTGIQPLESLLPEVQKWLTECDRFKFTGTAALNEEKQEHYRDLIVLAEKIDAQREGAA